MFDTRNDGEYRFYFEKGVFEGKSWCRAADGDSPPLLRVKKMGANRFRAGSHDGWSTRAVFFFFEVILQKGEVLR